MTDGPDSESLGALFVDAGVNYDEGGESRALAGFARLSKAQEAFDRDMQRRTKSFEDFQRAVTSGSRNAIAAQSALDQALSRTTAMNRELLAEQREMPAALRAARGELVGYRRDLESLDRATRALITGQRDLRRERELAIIQGTTTPSPEAQRIRNAAQPPARTTTRRETANDVNSVLTAPALAAAGIFAASAKVAADYETALKKVQTVTKATDQETAGLGKQLLALSTDQEKSRDTAIVLADGYYQIASAGYEGAAALDVLTAATKASGAGNTTTALTGKLLTDVLAAYGMQAQDARDVSDTLFRAVQVGSFDFEQLASSIGRVLAPAAATGVELDQVTAALATLTKGAIGPDQAVTYLTSLLFALSKSGVATTLSSRGLLAALKEVEAQTGGNTDALFKLLGNQEAVSASVSLLRNNARDFASDLAAVQDSAGATEDAFTTMGDAVEEKAKALRA
ncbi:MAG TPA: phage tail tape measure protein, partial [Herpetosiphonaceae bacterium]|nr:phage tail tape measure protein [Herpetosiphonaceae bacterium]